MTTSRTGQSATLLPDGKVLVAGGFNASFLPVSSAELYNPATGKWAATGSMSTPREGHDATLLPNGDVLVTAGVETAGVFSELYNPATGQWSTATGGLQACGTATECRFGSSAALLGTGKVLVTGGLAGTNSNPGTTNAAILYNPATNSWTTTGSMTTAREGQTADLLASGQVLVAGGETFAKHVATPLSSAELYTP
jgi:N-acetylneuraminic acid mutarotase